MSEIELVLHTSFGGFHFDTEMALWLSENRGWNIIRYADFDYKERGNYPVNTLLDMNSCFLPPNDNVGLRSNKDLIDCVRALQAGNNRYVHRLTIMKVVIHVEIEDYHDGRERVNCWAEQLKSDAK